MTQVELKRRAERSQRRVCRRSMRERVQAVSDETRKRQHQRCRTTELLVHSGGSSGALPLSHTEHCRRVLSE